MSEVNTHARDRAPARDRSVPAARSIELARALYARHGLDFQQDLEYHLAEGFVVALPTCFAMATCAALEGGRKAWFVKVATGNLQHLAALVPFPLPFIAFHRWKSSDPTRMHIYPAELVNRFSAPLSGFRSPVSGIATTTP